MIRISKLVTTLMIGAVVVTCASQPAKSGDKRCRLVCDQATPVTCQPVACQAPALVQTCCQPAAGSVQGDIQLTAHAQPATPRKLVPTPDTLNLQPTVQTVICAVYMWADWGSFSSYYAIDCNTGQPQNLNGNLDPVPGDCQNPNGGCIIFGSSVTPTKSPNGSYFNRTGTTQNGIRLKAKRKAGAGPIDTIHSNDKSTQVAKSRERIGQPIYVKLHPNTNPADEILLELQQYKVTGIGKNGTELTGIFSVGFEVESAPAGRVVTNLAGSQVTIKDPHVAQIKLGNVTYEVVTASKLIP
jgi:hypothetical protein